MGNVGVGTDMRAMVPGHPWAQGNVFREVLRRQPIRWLSETTMPSGPRTWAISQVFSC